MGPARMGRRGAAVATTFADRWGVPVQASSEKGVALLDEAIESLAALAGDPVATAEAASAADDQLVLSRIYQAYLALYGTTPEGLVLAAGLLDGLGPPGRGLAERETYHLAAARAWAAGHWEQAARALERALLAHPRDLLALKVAQDLYFFLGRRLDLRDVAARVLPAWPPGQPGWGYVQGIYAFAWRRTRPPAGPRPGPGGRCPTTRGTCGPCTHWPTCSRWRAASARAWTSCPGRP